MPKEDIAKLAIGSRIDWTGGKPTMESELTLISASFDLVGP